MLDVQAHLELAGENLEGSGLADTVGADETEHLTGARHREPEWHKTLGHFEGGDEMKRDACL